MSLKKQHISYSELTTFLKCRWQHKLRYKDKVYLNDTGLFAIFGKSVHKVAEDVMSGFDRSNLPDHFTKIFVSMIKEELKDLNEEGKKLALLLNEQGRPLVKHIFRSVEKEFGECEVFSVEEKLFEPIERDGMKFKGFVDLVIKVGDKYHLIDWKTTTWGWDARKRSSAIVTYQLTLYKHYFAKKHNIDPKNIETYFGLLKRTAKKDPVEIFRVTSGNKKTQNALKLLTDSLYNIENGMCVRNKTNCQYCEYKHTEWC